MNYSQFVYLILCLGFAYLALGVLTNDNLVNLITGNKQLSEIETPSQTVAPASGSGLNGALII